jgi:hypothetical protein
MPPVFRFYLRQVAIGFAAAGTFVGLLLWQDVAGLRGLIAGSPDGPLALVLLFVFNGLVFAGAQAGVAVFLMADRDEPPSGRRDAAPMPSAVPVVRRQARTRSRGAGRLLPARDHAVTGAGVPPAQRIGRRQP